MHITIWCNICNIHAMHIASILSDAYAKLIQVEGKILHLACLICRLLKIYKLHHWQWLQRKSCLSPKQRLCAMPIQGKMFSEEGGTFLCELDYRYFECKHPIVVILLQIERAQQRESLPKCDLCKLPLEGKKRIKQEICTYLDIMDTGLRECMIRKLLSRPNLISTWSKTSPVLFRLLCMWKRFVKSN